MKGQWRREKGVKVEGADGEITVRRWKRQEQRLSHHYPAVATRDGETWVLSLAYDAEDQQEALWLSELQGKIEPVCLRRTEAALLSPAPVVTADGALWILWIEGPAFALRAGRFDFATRRLHEPLTLSQPGTRCMHLVHDQNEDGLWLAWEAWTADGACAIHTRTRSPAGDWSERRELTPPQGRAYWPTLTVAGGRLWLAWCTPNAQGDGYDTIVAFYPRGEPSLQRAHMFRANDGLPGNFHVYPFLQRNREGQVWIAWVANTDLEYYDLIQWPGNSDYAYIQDEASRRKRNIWWKQCNVVLLKLSPENEQLIRRRLPGTKQWGAIRETGHVHYPALLPAASGVPPLLARRLTDNYLFETVRSSYDGSGWDDPRRIHPPLAQVGRNGPMSVAAEPGGGAYTVVQQAVSVQATDRFIGARPSATGTLLTLTWREEEQAPVPDLLSLPAVPPGAWEETSVPPAPRRHPSLDDGRRLFFGNIHVHSDLSGCRRDTQQTVDFNYRWARDLMQQDFHALTDHAEHMTPYDWKWTRTMQQFFNFPGHFVAILAYEWTMNDFGDRAHSGHCNVLLRRPIPQALGCDREISSTLPKLWAQLEPGQAMTIPHHTASYPFLRDFEMHDPALERLIEVQQDRRGNYEYAGCPGEYGTVVPLQAKEHNVRGGYVADALQKGLRLGLCAGGDHMGISMSGVLAQALESEAIFDALHRRQCYGTTGAAIVLDVKAAAERATGDVTMGATLHNPQASPFTVTVQVQGTAPVESIDLISAGQVLAGEAEVGRRQARVRFALPGDALPEYYYVRVMQEDGQMAWSSPIWIEDKETT